MKHLLLIILIATTVSCGNKKEVIVEQIKSYKDSLALVAQREAKLLDEIMRVQSLYIGQQAIDSVNAIEMKQAKEKAAITVDRFRFQGKIDSLELELKKY